MDQQALPVPHHPLDIRPSGNAYTADTNIKANAGSFSCMPDELIVRILEHLNRTSLMELGRTCKALYAFSRLEDLWKVLFLSSPPSSFTWYGTWRSTFLGVPEAKTSRVSCRNLFSDVLHRPFLCTHAPLDWYSKNIPIRNCISRLASLSSVEFASQWADRPFILAGEVTRWPLYQDWSTESLLKAYGEVTFRAEAVDWPLRTYVEYMKNNSDESPLYLFDRAFVEKTQIIVGKDVGGQYWAPECFGEDLFAVLGDQRPDSRWLIVGPRGSGSTFHKDPNATSAWNAVIRGSKYWIIFPTSTACPPPPGVYVSEDQSEVTSPLSIAEWLLAFHTEARSTPGCMEGICGEGEVLHVPSGWWHLVVNLRPSIAITQNFVPEMHLVKAVAFLKDKPDQISGFRKEIRNPYELFIRRLEEVHPELLSGILEKLGRLKQGRKRKWEQLVKGSAEGEFHERSFSFGFGEADDDDVP